MKTLNEYIKESLLDDEDDLVNDSTVLIEQFLKDNYNIKGTYTIDNGIVDVKGNITFKGKTDKLTNEFFKFGKVIGTFTCGFSENLKSLEGAPEKVSGEFNCMQCVRLETLKGAPKEVGGDFDCNTCNKLTSLEGSPKIVKGHFSCRSCNNLKTLKGLPKEVGKHFFCELCKSLDTVQPAYEVTKGTVYS